MKSKTLLAGVVILVVLLAGVIAAAAQGPRLVETVHATTPLPLGTGFTYQGQLKSSGAPVNTPCDFIFKLYDHASGGAQVGSNLPATITVTNGLFTTLLDFGTSAFTGDARWLDMQVGCPTGASPIALAPRQALTPAPMALALPGLWTQQNGTSPNLIGGYSGNVISTTVVGGTIGGGGSSGSINRIASPGNYATIGGGTSNSASNFGATVSGGSFNTASGFGATVGGGESNAASVDDATVGGGSSNKASALNATVPGGASNTASGATSFAAGQYANTNHHDGAFVWGDSSVTTEISATAPNQFLIRAAGGVGINTNAPVANGLTVNGKIFATGGFNGQCLTNVSNAFSTNTTRACNMDVAEAFASLDRTEPGDVVALVAQPAGTSSPVSEPTVRKASRSDGALVVGVVSSNPGLVFDNGQTHLAGDNSQLITADRTVVALVGRVPVKASLENGPIAVGDPLTGASVAGFAMKATQAGQILGYALQSSDALSEGKLLAWLQPGLYVPPQLLARLNAGTSEPDSAAQVSQLQTRNAALGLQNASLEARVTALEQASQSKAGPGRAADSGIPTPWLLFGGMIVLGVVVLRRRS